MALSEPEGDLWLKEGLSYWVRPHGMLKQVLVKAKVPCHLSRLPERSADRIVLLKVGFAEAEQTPRVGVAVRNCHSM